MSQAIDARTPPLPLPTSPLAIAQSVGTGFVPVIYHPDHRFERLPRRAKISAELALRHAEKVIWYRKIRSNVTKRRLAAISDPRWLEVVAWRGLRQKPVHTPVNRERTGFAGWL